MSEQDNTVNPIVVDLGKKSRKKVKKLQKGQGVLMQDVNDCVAELQHCGRIPKDSQPVIIVVEKKQRTGLWGLVS